MALAQNQKGLLSLIGGLFIHLAFGCILPLGSFNVYIISYVNHFQQHNPYPLTYGYFIMPIITFTMALFGPVGGIIDYALGCHITLLISAAAVVGASVMMYFVTHMWLIYVALIFYGIGSGLSFMAPIKNACFFFPEKKGIISATIGACGGLGGALYTFFGESIINPNNIQLTEGELYYDYEIARNTLNYYLFQAIVVAVGACLGVSLIYKYTLTNPNSSIPKTEQNLIIDSNAQTSDVNINNSEENIQIILSPPIDQLMQVDQSKYKEEILIVFKSKRIWLLFILNFCSGFLSFLMISTFKVIGTTQMFSIKGLKIASVGAALGATVFAPLWGLLYDYFGFKYLIAIINFGGVALGVSICFSMNNEIFFVSLMIFNIVILSGIMSVFHPHTMKVFGIKYVTELGGLMGFVPAISTVVASLFAFFVSLYLAERSDVFYISYLIGALLHLISFFLAFFETGLPFNYNEARKEEDKAKEEEDEKENPKDALLVTNN